MSKTLICIFLIAHLLGDFYLQSNYLAEKKRLNYKYVLWHCFCYLIVSIACILVFYSNTLLYLSITLALLHFVLDSVKYFITKGKELSSLIYILDQVFHLLCIVAIGLYIYKIGYDIKILPAINKYLLISNTVLENICIWVTAILISIKPINITIKQVLAGYKPDDTDEEKSVKNAGALIGALERLIMLLFLAIGQYAAIGLVLTAKSIARYNKISESKQFAEYYLIGTLLSTLSVIIIHFAL